MLSYAGIRSRFSFDRKIRWAEYVLTCMLALFLVLVMARFSFKMGAVMAVLGIGFVGAVLSFKRLQIGYYGMLALGFLMAMFSRMVPVNLPWFSIVFLLPFLLFSLLLVASIVRRKQSWLIWHPLTIMFIITTVYMFVQLFNPYMDSLMGWVSAFRGRMSYVFFFFITLYLLKDIKSVRFLFKFFLGAAFITGLYGCIQQWYGFAWFDRRWISDPRVHQLFSLPGGGVRKFSFLTDPANFGTLMASTGIGTLVMSFGPFRKREKLLMWIFAACMFLGMSYSGTRTAYLMAPAGLGLYILMNIDKRRTQLLAVSAVVAVLALLYAPIYGNPTINRLRSAFQPPSNDASFNIRTIHKHQIQPYIYAHPFGGGVNTAGGNGLKYNPNHPLAHFPPDSAYLGWALELGWVGYALQCIFLFMILFYGVHYYYKCKDPEIKTYYAVMVVTLFPLMVGAYAQFTFNMPSIFFLYAFMACIIRLHKFDSSQLTISNP